MTVTGAHPWIENLRMITDTVTGRYVRCTAKQIDDGFAWRTGIVDTVGADGGIDTVPGRNFLKPRTISCTLIKTYNPGIDTFKTASRDMELVLNPGNPLTLTFVEDDGREWYWDVRVQAYDKTHSLKWVGYMEFPITFIAPDPRQRAAFKPGIYLLDDGLWLDDTPVWYLDNDPDTYPLTGTQTLHYITNDGNAADEAPILMLYGPINPNIYVTYFRDGIWDIEHLTLQWAYVGSIAAGEILTVDAEQMEVTSSNANIDAYGQFVAPAHTRSWGRIEVGQTLLVVQYGSVGTGAACSVQWWPRK